MLRVVIDTNIFVSALLSRGGIPAQVLQAWKERRFILLTSPDMIAEVAGTLAGFIGRTPYNVSQQDVDDVVELLKTTVLEVSGTADVTDAEIPDPDDLIFLACALDGEADYIASGDKHLKTLEIYHSIPILTARELLERLDAEEK